MPEKKPIKSKEHQARKPVVQQAVADTSGSSLADFKNVVVKVGSKIGKDVNAFLKPGGGLEELTGYADAKRFVDKPSVTNALGVVLSAAQYIAPQAKPISEMRAVNAANTARSLPVAESALTRTMRLTKNEITGMREGTLRGVGEVRRTTAPTNMEQSNLFGRDMGARNFTAFETAKSAASVSQGRALAASQRAIQQGKQAETILKTVAVTNAARQIITNSNKKDTKKK
jgi:hypothetical protein